jgi:hypothetical protein
MQDVRDVVECDSSKIDLRVLNSTDLCFVGIEQSKRMDASTDSTVGQHYNVVNHELSTEDSACMDFQMESLDSEPVTITKIVEEHQCNAIVSDRVIVDVLDENEADIEPKRSCSSCIEEEDKPILGSLRRVRWGTIEMRLHSVIPGDHPDTREGPPVRSRIDSASTLFIIPYKKAQTLKLVATYSLRWIGKLLQSERLTLTDMKRNGLHD